MVFDKFSEVTSLTHPLHPSKFTVLYTTHTSSSRRISVYRTLENRENLILVQEHEGMHMIRFGQISELRTHETELIGNRYFIGLTLFRISTS